jgi:hypothetical protein
VGSYGYLKVDSLVLGTYKNGVPAELLAIFRNDMFGTRQVSRTDYFDDADEDEGVLDVVEFRAPAAVIADRLDVMGFEPAAALTLLEEALDRHKLLDTDPGMDVRSEYSRAWSEALRPLTADRWVTQLAAAVPGTGSAHEQGRVISSAAWLLDLLDEEYDPDGRFLLRLVLLARPAGEVILDVTDLAGGGWVPERPAELPSAAMSDMRDVAATHAPVVVLTEGKTDAEMLSGALAVLYPHLTDLVRFLDFDQKLEGSASALVRMVRAFAAAGIANKVVAIFDNDAAAREELTTLKVAGLPDNIRVLRYPDIGLASDYPTLGPPTLEAPDGSLARADVNGLAASIELYLGEDVLTLPDGSFRPVQWGALKKSGYQGVVSEKGEIQRLFREKLARAAADSSIVPSQDWTGMRMILDQILTAFRAPR